MQSHGSRQYFSCHLKRVLPFDLMSSQLKSARGHKTALTLKVDLSVSQVAVSLDCSLNIFAYIFKEIVVI